jgi:PAS domain S-box-containing protein
VARKQGIPLSFVIAAPIVALVLLAGSLVGTLSFRNGQRAVNDVAAQLRGELASRIVRHLDVHLATAQRITQTDGESIGRGQLDAGDVEGLQRVFLEQVRVFDSVTSVYFGNAAGGLADAGREGVGGSLYVIATDGLRSGVFRKHSIDARGQRGALLDTMPDFDARTRPWYKAAVARGDATWSDVYPLFTGQDLAIATSRPVYGPRGEFLGVMSADLFLSQLSDFLRGLRIGQTGQAFVIERNGLLVASSTGDRISVPALDGKPPARVSARDSRSRLIRASAEALVRRFGDNPDIHGSGRLELRIEGQRQFVEIDRITSPGLDWLVVVVIPEADYMGAIQENNRETLALVLLTLAIAAAAGVLHAGMFSRRIAALGVSAEALAQGMWERPVDEGGRVREIRGLTRSFNAMAARLRDLVKSLTEDNQRVRAAEEIARKSEQMYRLLAENATDVIWTMDADLRFTYVSPSVMALRGYTPDEALTQPLDLILTPASLAVAAQAIHEELQRGGLAGFPPGRTRALELEYLRKDGSTVWTEVHVSALRDPDGKPAGFLGVTRDITERRLAAERLIRAERLQAVGQLAAGVAHEFNNTLTAMMGHAELIGMAPRATVPTDESVRAILGAGQQAARLVTQILDFGRKSLRRPTRLDLLPAVTTAAEELRGALPQSVRLMLEVSAGDHVVYADSLQVRQVIANLVHNAADAMPGGGEIRLSLSRSHFARTTVCDACQVPIEGEWIVLSVEDQGNGMPPEVKAHIFEPFFTTKPVGQASGLGLSQVLGLVVQHSGHIAVESAVGEGTRVAVYLAPTE